MAASAMLPYPGSVQGALVAASNAAAALANMTLRVGVAVAFAPPALATDDFVRAEPTFFFWLLGGRSRVVVPTSQTIYSELLLR